MSANPMPMDFIGSRISLCSKSDIRYEGTLYSLDLREATISLCKVRSFGTEDRPTDRPIPIKDEIYEFIVFRGSDIKSIDVLSPPQRGSTMPCGLPQDPAIVEVSQFTRGTSNMNMGSHGHHCHDQNCRDHPIRYSTQRQGVFDSLLRGSGRPQRGNQRRGSNDNGNQPDRSRNNGGRQSNRGGERNPDNRSRQEYRGGSVSGNNGNNERNQESRRGRGNTPNRNNQGSNNNAANNRNNREGSRNRNQQARQRGIIEPQQPPKVTFEDPFDFEKSNEELKTAMEKLKLGGDEENKDADASGSNVADKKEEPLIYYDKDKFFDNISCEALERKQGFDFYDDFRKGGRVDWRAERKLNAETFGLPWNPNQPQRNQRNNNGNFGRSRNFRGFRGGMRYNYNRYNRNSSFGSGFNNGGNRGQP